MNVTGNNGRREDKQIKGREEGGWWGKGGRRWAKLKHCG